MGVRFSIVYPTRHRPAFIEQVLQVMELQRHDSFEVIVSDNHVDPALSCEQACHGSPLANLRYVRPSRPVGMVENWNHALQFATGDYILYLTDKMFVLPDALGRIDRAIDAAGGPEIVSWVSDAYNPAAYPDYLGPGQYVPLSAGFGPGPSRSFAPAAELDRRGRAQVARGEQDSSDYCRGKLVFGAYRRDLISRIVERHGALFHDINPDYTSMVLGLSAAHGAIELAGSCVVSVNTDISNGMRSDTDDTAALAYLSTLEGGAASILPRLFVPGLYVSLHNWVAHDLLSLKTAFDLPFSFEPANWLAYCIEDVERPSRRWSDPQVEADQKARLAAFVDSIEPAVAEAARERVAARARRARVRPSLPRRLTGRLRRVADRRPAQPWQAPGSWESPTILSAVARRAGG